jgi:NAD+ diphosphatase
MTIVNFYAGLGLDRVAYRRRDPAWIAERLADPETMLIPVWRSLSLVLAGDQPEGVALHRAEATLLLGLGREPTLLGIAGERAVFALDLSHLDDPIAAAGLAGRGEFLDLRQVGPLIERGQGSLLAYARGLLWWHQRHRFCGACGAPTESSDAGHARRCTNPACGVEHFPRTDPAVIMLVTHGDRALLGRQASWPKGMHSTLAGFVEPGESLEEAVRREVLEEVGVEVADIAYQSSQPWPFPASIMLGFTARALDTRLRLDSAEIEAALWLSREELRASPENEHLRLPRRDSIARRLVDDWIRSG